MSNLKVLKQPKGENEEVVAVFLPTKGKVALSELSNALGISQPTLKSVVVKKNIKIHKLSTRLVSRWIVDLEDFWEKTEEE